MSGTPGTPGATTAGAPGETPRSPDKATDTPRHPFRPVVALMVLVVLGLTATAGFKSYRDLDTARSYERELLAKIAKAKERVRVLDHRIDRIRNDPTMLETLAREDLGLARDGEVVIMLPDERLSPRAQSSARWAATPAPAPGTSITDPPNP